MSGEIWADITSRPAEDPAAEPTVERVDAQAVPRRMRSVAITGIFVLAIFYTLYFTAEIAVPLVFALLFKLLLQPGVRVLGRIKVPQPLGALAMIILLFAVLGGGGYLLAGPATAWLERAPDSLPRLEQHLRVFKRPIQQVQEATKQVEQLTQNPGEGKPIAVKGPGLVEYLFASTRHLMSGLGITVLMLFFLLSSGELFMRRLVEILPNFRDKKRAVEMSYEVEENISAYLLTISIMNALVGLAAGLSMWAIGVPDPILWGALAFILNYVLILGPLTGMALFFVAGLMSFDALWQALIPPGAYLIIHMIEGEWVTPMLVAKRFTLNPVLVIGSLIFWDWMWGIPGALLAVPMLAVFKIVCDRVRPLAALGHFIEG
jgi:predicted PurR-regulated permease PerM